MSGSRLNKLDGKWQVRGVVLAQMGMTIIIALGSLASSNLVALSALLGGLIACVVSGFTVGRFFGPYRAQEPGKLLANLYGMELRRILLTALLFAGTFICFGKLNIGMLIGSFLIVQILVPPFVMLYEERMKTR